MVDLLEATCIRAIPDEKKVKEEKKFLHREVPSPAIIAFICLMHINDSQAVDCPSLFMSTSNQSNNSPLCSLNSSLSFPFLLFCLCGWWVFGLISLHFGRDLHEFPTETRPVSTLVHILTQQLPLSTRF